MKKLAISIFCTLCVAVVALKAVTEAEVILENFLDTYLTPSSNAALVRIDSWQLGTQEHGYVTVYFNAKVMKVIKGGFTLNSNIQFFEVFEGTPTTADMNARLAKKFYIFPENVSSQFFVDVGERWEHTAALETAVTNAGY